MAWDEAKFRERVKNRAREIDRSVRSVLMEAGVALDILEKVPIVGRRVDTIEKIAHALGWDGIEELMGFEIRAKEDVMRQAYTIADRALRGVMDREDAMAVALTLAYNVLLRQQRDGRPIDDPGIVSTLQQSIVEALGSAARRRPPRPRR